MAFDRFDCATCGSEFKASEDANAADGPYCSPVCESDGKRL